MFGQEILRYDAFVVSNIGDFAEREDVRLAVGNSGNTIINARDTITLKKTEVLSIILSSVQKNSRGNFGARFV